MTSPPEILFISESVNSLKLFKSNSFLLCSLFVFMMCIALSVDTANIESISALSAMKNLRKPKQNLRKHEQILENLKTTYSD